MSRRRMGLAYVLALGLPVLTVFIRVGIIGYKVGDPPTLILFLLPVVVSAYLGGAGPGLLATALSAFLTDYFLLSPIHSVLISGRINLALWITQVLTGVLISVLTGTLHRSRRKAELSHVEQLVTLTSIGDAVITSDAGGSITFLNPGAERLTGWSREEAIGQELASVFRIVNEETGETVEDPAHRVISQGRAVALPGNTVLVARDGRRIPVEDSSAPIKAADGSLQGIVLVFRDATEGRRSEKALKDQLDLRNQLASIAETAPGVICSFRRRSDGTMCFPYASPHIEDIYGLRPEQLADDASPAFNLMDPDDVPHVNATIAESIRTMEPWHDEFRVFHPQRGEIWVEGHSTPQLEPDGSILWQGFLSDVTERRKAEDLLRQSDRQMRLVTDHMPGMVAYVDAEYRYRFVNRNYHQWFGRPQWDIVGKTVPEIMGQENFAAVQGYMDRALSGQPVTFEVTRGYPAGQRILHASYVPDADATGRVNGLYALIVDVTERKQTERDLREKDRILREAMRAARLVAWESEVATGSLKEEGPVAEMFFRTSSRSPSVEEWIEDVHPDDRAMVLGRIQAALEQGMEYSLEFRTRVGPNGHSHWVQALGEVERDESGKPLRIRGIAMDVTERKLAEQALQSSQSQLKTALEAGRMGVWISDVRTDHVWLDATGREIWGLPLNDNAELAASAIRAMVHPDDVQRILAMRENLFRKGTESSTEFRVLRQDGSVSWIASKGRLERDAAGNPLRQVGILMDITERKRGEEAQMRSQKLEALGTLSGGIAHDFNNILLAINENARLVAEELSPDHSAQESLAEIRKAGQRAVDLVRQILAFSRPGQKRKQVQALAPVVEEALKLVRATIPANIRFEMDIAGDLPLVAADSGQIYQIIVNLATNAAHAIGPKPGLIAIKMEAVQSPSPLNTSPGLEAGEYLMLTVRDNGCGMDMATLDRIFDPFFTTKPQGQGSGLGLSMVHGIMKNHDGAIAVSSEVGKGTSFQLYFPTSRSKVENAVPGKESGAPLGELRVLYVDDEESLVSLAGRALRRLGYKVTGFTDPQEALQSFQAAPHDFDIVVTDLAMPHLSGFDLTRKLMAVRPEIPIVLISGYVRPADEEMALLLGVREVILKPSSIEEMGRRLDKIFRDTRQASAPAGRTP